MKIYLAKHRGFCMGVKRSIRMAQNARAQVTGPVHILNDIVHNKTVVQELEQIGLGRVKSIDEAESGTIIISAHGVPPKIIADAKARGLNVIDSTCPLVKHIHRVAREFIKNGYAVILFGDPGHDEVKGIAGIDKQNIIVLDKSEDIPNLPEFNRPVAFISQSTRSTEKFEEAAELLKKRYGQIEIKNTICMPTLDRQSSIKQLAPMVELVIVVGSPTSANSQRLAQIAHGLGTKAYLIDNALELDESWFDNIARVGITAGASTPDLLIDDVIKRVTHIASSNNQEAELVEVF
jgi:4-hydroxy-3-methylbut-2-en-1-yl diphosphate reductase